MQVYSPLSPSLFPLIVLPLNRRPLRLDLVLLSLHIWPRGYLTVGDKAKYVPDPAQVVVVVESSHPPNIIQVKHHTTLKLPRLLLLWPPRRALPLA